MPREGDLKPDGSAPYDQEVMTKLMELQGLGRIKIAFDRAGTSNASEEDNEAFRAAEGLKQIQPDNPTWKKIIKDTKWFQSYTGGVKKFLAAEAQGFDGTQVILCIDGGTITQVEQEEMSRILSEAAGDAAKSGLTLRTRMQTMSYCEFLRQFAQPAAPADALGAPPAAAAPQAAVKTLACFVSACEDIDSVEELFECSAEEMAELFEEHAAILKSGVMGKKQREKLLAEHAQLMGATGPGESTAAEPEPEDAAAEPEPEPAASSAAAAASAAVQPEPEPEQLLLALIKWAAKGAERLDHVALSRLAVLVLGGSEEMPAVVRRCRRDWPEMCKWLGSDASEGLGLAHLQVFDDSDGPGKPGGEIARWVVVHPRAAEYDALLAAAIHPLNPQLVEAARKGDVAAIERLVSEGVSPDAKNENGGPAVVEAAFLGHTAAVEALLRLGADPDAPSQDGMRADGAPALRAATVNGHAGAVAALLQGGAAVDVAYDTGDDDGFTALMQAAQSGQAECARLLLRAGADASLRHAGGETALDVAEKEGKADVAALLRG